MSVPELPFDPFVIVDGFAYVSGQIATDAESKLVAQGRVGAEVDVDTAVRCAEACAPGTCSVSSSVSPADSAASSAS